jgi:hypothetical protein
MMWTVLPEWLGETVFILGCGPSLVQVRTEPLLQAGRVIAINDAYTRCPGADILYFCDKKWWLQHERMVAERFYGRRIVTMLNEYPGIHTLRCTGEVGLETDPGGVRHGSNSGYQCINLAYHLGAARIVLMGYDMRVVNGKLHHTLRTDLQTEEGFQRTLQHKMLPKFQTLAAPLQEAGVTVLNATPNSALRVWPLVPLEAILRGASLEAMAGA